MRVVALKAGYYGSLRAPGEEFDVPDNARASWFAPDEATEGETAAQETVQEAAPAGKERSRKKGKDTLTDLV